MGDSRRLVLVAFIASAVLGGGNAVGVRFSNRELDALFGAGVRFALAGVLLFAWVLLRRLPLPRSGEWKGPIVFGLFNYGAAFSFAYYGLVELRAGFGQTLLAMVPLFTLLLAVAHGQERLSFRALAGTLVAAAGVAVMSGLSLDGPTPILAILSLLAAAASFAEAAVQVRRFPRVHPITMNAIAACVGAVVLFGLSWIAGDAWRLPTQVETWVAIGYLVVVGSAIVFGLYLYVLDNWSASRTAFGFVIIPLVTFVLSAWLDDESVGPELAFGASLVLIGVYLGAIRPRTLAS